MTQHNWRADSGSGLDRTLATPAGQSAPCLGPAGGLRKFLFHRKRGNGLRFCRSRRRKQERRRRCHWRRASFRTWGRLAGTTSEPRWTYGATGAGWSSRTGDAFAVWFSNFGLRLLHRVSFRASSFWQLSREAHPSVKCRGTLLTSAAGPDSDGIGRLLDHVAEADFFLDEKSRQPHAMGRPFVLLRLRLALFLSCGFLPSSCSSLHMPPRHPSRGGAMFGAAACRLE